MLKTIVKRVPFKGAIALIAAPLLIKPSLGFLRQEQPSTCAVACLRMVAVAYGKMVTERELAENTELEESA